MASKHRELVVVISGDERGLNRAFARAGTGAEKFGRQANAVHARVGSSFAGMAKRAVAAGAAFGGAYVAIGAAKHAISATEELAKGTANLHRLTGMSIKSSSEWAAVAKSRGVDATQLGRGFITLSKQIEAANQGSAKSVALFKDLGVSQEAIRKGDTQVVLGQIADAFERMPNGAHKSAEASKLFGRQAQTLLPLLNAGSRGLQDQLRLADKYGVTLNSKTQPQIMKLVKAQRELKIAGLGLQVQFTTALAPALLKVEHAALRVIRIFEGGGSLSDKLAKAGKVVAPLARSLRNSFEQALPQIANAVAAGAPRVAGAFVTGFLHANVFGQIVLGAFLLKRLGLLGPALRGMGARLGMGFGTSFGTTAAETGAARTEAGMAASSARFGKLGKGLGKALGLGITVAVLADLPNIEQQLGDALGLGKSFHHEASRGYRDLIPGMEENAGSKSDDVRNHKRAAERARDRRIERSAAGRRAASQYAAQEPGIQQLARRRAAASRLPALGAGVGATANVGGTRGPGILNLFRGAAGPLKINWPAGPSVKQYQHFIRTLGDAGKVTRSFASTVVSNVRRANSVPLGIAKSFQTEASKTRRVTSGLTHDVLSSIQTLPPKARKQASDMVVGMASQMESRGQLPKGAAKQIRDAIVGHFGKASVDSIAASRRMADGVGGNVSRLRSGVQGGMSGLSAALDAQLRKLGVSAHAYIAGQFAGRAGNVRAGAATGGLWTIGQEGERGADTELLSLMVGRGEKVAVFNGSQQALMDRRLGDMGGLEGMFARVKRPHYAASGGVIPRETLAGSPGSLTTFGQRDLDSARQGANQAYAYVKANMAGEYHSPLSTLAGFSLGRVDHGRDFETRPGASVLAIGAGAMHYPGSFPGSGGVLALDKPKYGVRFVYYGHARAGLGKGRVSAGDAVAVAGGVGAPGMPGHMEIGPATGPSGGLFGVQGHAEGPQPMSGNLVKLLHDADPKHFGRGGMIDPHHRGFWSLKDTVGLLYMAGLRDPNAIARLAAKTRGESGGQSGNVGDGGDSIGLFQIDTAFNHYPKSKLYDPLYNAKAAISIYRSQGIGAWHAPDGPVGTALHWARKGAAYFLSRQGGQADQLVYKYDQRTGRKVGHSAKYWARLRRLHPAAAALYKSTPPKKKASATQAAAPAERFPTLPDGFYNESDYEAAKASVTPDEGDDRDALTSRKALDERKIAEVQGRVDLQERLLKAGRSLFGSKLTAADKRDLAADIANEKVGLTTLYGDLASTNQSLDQLGKDSGSGSTPEDVSSLLTDIRDQLKRQNDWADGISGVTSREAVRALADMLSGQIAGRGIAPRSATAGAGSVATF